MCLWKFDTESFDGVYTTQCNNLHTFSQGNLDSNHYNYCPYCGQIITIL